MKKILFLALLFIICIAGCSKNVQEARHPFGEPHNKHTQIATYTRIDNEVESGLFLEYKRVFDKFQWVPIKGIFEPFVDKVYMDEKDSFAYIENGGKRLVLNFSGKSYNSKRNEVAVPLDYALLIDGEPCIDAYWLAWIFDSREEDSFNDLLKKEWFTPEKERLRNELKFLNINYSSILFYDEESIIDEENRYKQLMPERELLFNFYIVFKE